MIVFVDRASDLSDRQSIFVLWRERHHPASRDFQMETLETKLSQTIRRGHFYSALKSRNRYGGSSSLLGLKIRLRPEADQRGTEREKTSEDDDGDLSAESERLDGNDSRHRPGRPLRSVAGDIARIEEEPSRCCRVSAAEGICWLVRTGRTRRT